MKLQLRASGAAVVVHVFLFFLFIYSQEAEGKDIFADVLCAGIGAGTEENPYCVLSQAFADASFSTGDVRIWIYGSWLVTPFTKIDNPMFSSLTLLPWKGSLPSISCYVGLSQPLLSISNTQATITIEGLTIASCVHPNSQNSKPAIVFSNVRSVVLRQVFMVDGGRFEVTSSSTTFNSSVEIYDSQFIGNSGGAGGALYIDNITSALINNTNFLSNVVDASASSGHGGAAYLNTQYLYVGYSNFLQNSADTSVGGSGGGMYIANFANKAVTKTVQHTNFIGNVGSKGGGVYFYMSGNEAAGFKIDIERCSFRENRASGTISGRGTGAGLHVDGSATSANRFDVVVAFSAFQANNAAKFGGGIYITGPSGVSKPWTVELKTLLMIGNQASGGSAVDVTHMFLDMHECVLQSNTLWGADPVRRGIINMDNTYTGSKLASVQVTSSFTVDTVWIEGATTDVIYIEDSDFSSNLLLGSALEISGVRAELSTTTIWGNFAHAIEASSGANVFANNSVSIYANNLVFFTLAPFYCTGGSFIALPGGTQGCGCPITDRCGVCTWTPTTDCLCPGGITPAFINCTAPLVLQLPNTLSATYSPANGLPHAQLLPEGVTPSTSAAGVTLRYLSLTDLVNNSTLLLNQFKPGRPVKSVTLDVNNVYFTAFTMGLENVSTVVISQTVFQDTSIVSSGQNNILVVEKNSLKLGIDYSAKLIETTELLIEVVTDEAIISAQLNESVTLYTAMTKAYNSKLITATTTVRFAMANFAILTLLNDSQIAVPVDMTFRQVNNVTVQITVVFPGPFKSVNYDPDFSVLVNEDSGGGGDGDGDETLLIEILVPSIVGSALVIVVLAILVIVSVVAIKWYWVHRTRNRSNNVNFD